MPSSRGSDLVHELFGVALQDQGRGFYVTLELLALARGTFEATGKVLDSGNEALTYNKASMDLARRLANRSEIPEATIASAMRGDDTRRVLEALFQSLLVAIPGRRTSPKWFNTHLYPYVGELVHYDATDRRGRINLDRYIFRDAGGLAHHILRTDVNEPRLAETREGLTAIVQDSRTSLGVIAKALRAHDEAQPNAPFTETSEPETIVLERDTVWIEHLRSGTNRIVKRSDLATAKRVEYLMHWVPYCIARHQLALAQERLGQPPLNPIPVDTRAGSNPVRTLSRDALEAARWDIVKALRSVAWSRMERAQDEHDKDLWRDFADSTKWCASPRGFFTGTLAAVGGLNANAGRRHFTLKPPLLESLVNATFEPHDELDFEAFCIDRLYGDYSIVVDEQSAADCGMTTHIDGAEFRDNGEALAGALKGLGLLSDYSDTTRMVHGEVK